MFAVFCHLRFAFFRASDLVLIFYPPSVLEFTQEFITGSHPPDSQQGNVKSLSFLSGAGGLLEFTPGAGFSVSLPGVDIFSN